MERHKLTQLTFFQPLSVKQFEPSIVGTTEDVPKYYKCCQINNLNKPAHALFVFSKFLLHFAFKSNSSLSFFWRFRKLN